MMGSIEVRRWQRSGILNVRKGPATSWKANSLKGNSPMPHAHSPQQIPIAGANTHDGPPSLTRRAFLPLAAGLASGLGTWPLKSTWGQPTPGRRPRIAAIFTVLRFRSHAYNILENFLGPYHFNGKLIDPGVDVVSFYADQKPEDDMAAEVAERFSIPLCETIEQALCTGDTKLAVDGVLIIGEHGHYPYNDRGQHLYPRKRFFDQSVAVMRRSQRFVPVFNDKHLSWSWDEALEMYETARHHRFPLMAGSSVPLAQRKPELTLPPNAEIEEAVSIHGGGLESYDFHALEVLQSFVESRHGGETGVERVELLTGEAFERARRDGRWSEDLVEAAMAAEQTMDARRQPHPQVGVMRAESPSVRNGPSGSLTRPTPSGPYAICLTYRDGLRATVLRIGSDANRWNFACRLRGEEGPRATAIFNSPWGNRGLFKALSHAIQHLFRTGKEPYPVQRTLLTTGMVEAVMRSHEKSGQPIETPHLALPYETSDWSPFRETGATWSILTAETRQPTRFEPLPWETLK
jgi:hypothetical protein